MLSGLVLLPLLLAASGSVCGPAGEEPLRRTLLAELNQVRLEAGQEPVAVHPALCDLARDRAGAVAASGGLGSSAADITRTTGRLYRAGYAPHSWTEGSLIATADAGILDQWRHARPEWFEDAANGDFEDAGIAVARYRGRPVVLLVLALRARTVEWRQAEPLKDLAEVRRLARETVNALRLENGRRAVRSDDRLDAAAQEHAEDMLRREYYAHESPEGETPGQRVRAVGHRGARSVGENIAKGPFTPDEVVRRWMRSSGHRRNILKRDVTEMGMGVAFGENANGFEVLWVQVFAAR